MLQTYIGKGAELHGMPVTAQQIWEAMSSEQQADFVSIGLSDLVNFGKTKLRQGEYSKHTSIADSCHLLQSDFPLLAPNV